MRIGIDFDNTIVCYDGVFHRAAVERDLIAPEVPDDKTAVRDHLRRQGREQDWIELQGYVYGSRMDLAAPYPGFTEFLAQAPAAGIEIRIISHRTRHPYGGPRYDLHAEARRFLERTGCLNGDGGGVAAAEVFFELTKADKLDRIASEACDVFVDDLPEFLTEPAFPVRVERVLFDPKGAHAAAAAYRSVGSWPELSRLLLARVSA